MGHAVIYAAMYQLCRMPWIWRYHRPIEVCLGKFAFIAAFFSLFLIKDVGGLICYLIVLFILHYRKTIILFIHVCDGLLHRAFRDLFFNLVMVNRSRQSS
jgi:hypothetical protein